VLPRNKGLLIINFFLFIQEYRQFPQLTKKLYKVIRMQYPAVAFNTKHHVMTAIIATPET